MGPFKLKELFVETAFRDQGLMYEGLKTYRVLIKVLAFN